MAVQASSVLWLHNMTCVLCRVSVYTSVRTAGFPAGDSNRKVHNRKSGRVTTYASFLSYVVGFATKSASKTCYSLRTNLIRNVWQLVFILTFLQLLLLLAHQVSVRKTVGHNLANYGELRFSRSSLASRLGDRCIFSIFSTISLPYFTYMRPFIVTNFFVIKPTRCTNFTNLFCH